MSDDGQSVRRGSLEVIPGQVVELQYPANPLSAGEIVAKAEARIAALREALNLAPMALARIRFVQDEDARAVFEVISEHTATALRSDDEAAK